MSPSVYCAMSVPRHARFTASAREPARFYAHLLRHSLNHGLPARRRGGFLLAIVGRRGLPTTSVAAGLRLMPRRPAPDLDRLLRETERQWSSLAERSQRLPAAPPPLSALELERSSGRTVFVFGDGEYPVLVLKTPRAGHVGTDRETQALRLAHPASVAPRFLGRVGSSWAQEGMPGLPVWVEDVHADNAGHLEWTDDFAELTTALQRLASTTAHRVAAPAELLAALDRAQVPDLPARHRRLVAAARRDLSRLDVAVLQHGDLSAQNWLVNCAGFVGAVDWEMSTDEGVPGFDILHAAVSVFEHGVGLRSWSGSNVTQAFRHAWATSALFEGARTGVGTTAVSAGTGESLVQPLQVAFFARRLGRQVAGVKRYSVGTRELIDMLTAACAD